MPTSWSAKRPRAAQRPPPVRPSKAQRQPPRQIRSTPRASPPALRSTSRSSSPEREPSGGTLNDASSTPVNRTSSPSQDDTAPKGSVNASAAAAKAVAENMRCIARSLRARAQGTLEPRFSALDDRQPVPGEPGSHQPHLNEERPGHGGPVGEVLTRPRPSRRADAEADAGDVLDRTRCPAARTRGSCPSRPPGS